MMFAVGKVGHAFKVNLGQELYYLLIVLYFS